MCGLVLYRVKYIIDVYPYFKFILSLSVFYLKCNRWAPKSWNDSKFNYQEIRSKQTAISCNAKRYHV